MRIHVHGLVLENDEEAPVDGEQKDQVVVHGATDAQYVNEELACKVGHVEHGLVLALLDKVGELIGRVDH